MNNNMFVSKIRQRRLERLSKPMSPWMTRLYRAKICPYCKNQNTEVGRQRIEGNVDVNCSACNAKFYIPQEYLDTYKDEINQTEEKRFFGMIK